MNEKNRKNIQKQERQRRKRQAYAKQYYEKNRFSICKRTLEKSIPELCGRVTSRIPEIVQSYYTLYPYEQYGEPFAKKWMRYMGIREDQIMYQECYSAAMLAYIYSICQCALRGYEHTEMYIRKMMKILILCAMAVNNENKRLCRFHGLREIRLDALEQADRW